MFRFATLVALLPLLIPTAAAQTLENRQVMRQLNLFSSAHPGVRTDAISLSDGYVLARWDSDMGKFLSYSADEVSDHLRRHLLPGRHLYHICEAIETGAHPVLYIMLDIEHQLDPRHLWRYWDPEYYPEPLYAKKDVAEAYNMRMRVTKEVFKALYPEQEVKVGLFGTLHPSTWGNPGDVQFLKRRDTLKELGSLGMFDDADFLVPVLYTLFASTHVRYKEAAQYTLQGVDGSAAIRRSDGSSLPLMPLLSPRIYNRTQPPGLARVDWMQEVIDTIRSSGHPIEAISFWIAPSERDEVALAYFDQLFPPQDWNFDCISDHEDDLLFSGGISREEAMADMNRDGIVDSADWEVYQALAGIPPATLACGSGTDCPYQFDYFDFLLFQERFIARDRAADMNGDGEFDVFDFLLFMEQAANPCP